MNLIQTASTFQSELDKAAVEQAKTGWMEQNDKLVKYDGGAEVKIPKLDMDGLGDYASEGDGFAEGDIEFDYETKKMTMDRGRKFVFPEEKVPETAFVLTSSVAMGEFQRKKVIPEVDAYRNSTIGAEAINNGQATFGYSPTETDVLQKLYYDIAAVEDVVGETPLVIMISSKVAAILSMSEKLRRTIEVVDFKQGDVTLRVQALDGQYPLIRCGSARMKTKYLFRDGRSTEQKKGGFAPASDAKSMNWYICPKDAPIAVSRTDKMRIFDPETYQPKRAWAMDYRKFHDLWIPENRLQEIRVNVVEAQ